MRPKFLKLILVLALGTVLSLTGSWFQPNAEANSDTLEAYIDPGNPVGTNHNLSGFTDSSNPLPRWLGHLGFSHHAGADGPLVPAAFTWISGKDDCNLLYSAFIARSNGIPGTLNPHDGYHAILDGWQSPGLPWVSDVYDYNRTFPPRPPSMLLLASGLVGLFLLRPRKKKRA